MYGEARQTARRLRLEEEEARQALSVGMEGHRRASTHQPKKQSGNKGSSSDLH